MNDTDYHRPRVVADYIWNVTLAVPIIMAFVPGLWPLALHGFMALGQAPEWYRIAVEAALCFAFGRKGIETVAQAILASRTAKNPNPANPAGEPKETTIV